MLISLVADFMSKPFSVAELVARVRNLAQTAHVRQLLQRTLDVKYAIASLLLETD